MQTGCVSFDLNIHQIPIADDENEGEWIVFKILFAYLGRATLVAGATGAKPEATPTRARAATVLRIAMLECYYVCEEQLLRTSTQTKTTTRSDMYVTP